MKFPEIPLEDVLKYSVEDHFKRVVYHTSNSSDHMSRHCHHVYKICIAKYVYDQSATILTSF